MVLRRLSLSSGLHLLPLLLPALSLRPSGGRARTNLLSGWRPLPLRWRLVRQSPVVDGNKPASEENWEGPEEDTFNCT